MSSLSITTEDQAILSAEQALDELREFLHTTSSGVGGRTLGLSRAPPVGLDNIDKEIAIRTQLDDLEEMMRAITDSRFARRLMGNERAMVGQKGDEVANLETLRFIVMTVRGVLASQSYEVPNSYDEDHTMPYTGDPIKDFLRTAAPPVLTYPQHLRDVIILRPEYNPALHSRPDLFEKIVCPYDADAFESLLKKHNLTNSYPDLVYNLRHGFPLGEMPELTQTNVLRNPKNIADHWPEVDKYLLDEIKADRMDGPFTRAQVESILRGPFHSSPLITIIEPQGPGEPPKVRVCRHLSKATNFAASVNSFIDKTLFPTHLDTVIKVAECVATAPPGTEACTFDVEKFHRTCPVSPHHKPWIVVQGRPGNFYIDHVHPFGAASASSNAGMIANAMVDIWRREGVDPILKYEDDLSVLRLPAENGLYQSGQFSYTYDRSECLDIISPLGVPWHPTKGTPFFSSDFVFLGLRWNMTLKTVSLPEPKRLKYLDRVQTFISDHLTACKLEDLEKLLGSLAYICFVYLEGRSYVRPLIDFACSFEGESSKIQCPPPSVIMDLQWWNETLLSPTFSRPLAPLTDTLDVDIFVDASTAWGVGLILDNRWMAFKLRRKWNTPDDNGVRRGIAWLEMVAVELMIYVLHNLGYTHCKVLIHSDNMGVIGAVAKGRSTNPHLNHSIRRMAAITCTTFILPYFEYIESALNPADPISRGDLPPASARLPLNFELPPDLLSALKYV